MANRNIDERFRKPRRTKGTPFYTQRNYLALGVCALSGFSWFLFEQWSQTRKLKVSIAEGKFSDPPELIERIRQTDLALLGKPELSPLLAKLRDRIEAKAEAQYNEQNKEEEGKPKPCSAQCEEISKYFVKPPSITESTLPSTSSDFVDTECSSSENTDSPYKNSLKEINSQLNDSLSDEKDFMSPKPIVEKKNISLQKKTLLPKAKIQQRTRQVKKKPGRSFQKTIEDSFKNLDVNPDHLQMAIALSESAHQAENPEQYDNNSEETFPSFTDSQQKRSYIKSTLEQFGFKSERTKMNSYNPRSFAEVFKKRKKSKFAYITPTLLLRTDEDREAIITSKVSLILSQRSDENSVNTTNKDYALSSEKLRKYNSDEKSFFRINFYELKDLDYDGIFYTKSLSLPVAQPSCGCLLRDWKSIPGRDISPEKEINPDLPNSEETEMECVEIQNQDEESKLLKQTEKSFKRSISPDLFSDDEDILPVTSNSQESFSHSEISGGNRSQPSKFSLDEFQDDNGIHHFESFHEDAVKLSQGRFEHSPKNAVSEDLLHSGVYKSRSIEIDLTISSSDDEEKSSTQIDSLKYSQTNVSKRVMTFEEDEVILKNFPANNGGNQRKFSDPTRERANLICSQQNVSGIAPAQEILENISEVIDQDIFCLKSDEKQTVSKYSSPEVLEFDKNELIKEDSPIESSNFLHSVRARANLKYSQQNISKLYSTQEILDNADKVMDLDTFSLEKVEKETVLKTISPKILELEENEVALNFPVENFVNEATTSKADRNIIHSSHENDFSYEISKEKPCEMNSDDELRKQCNLSAQQKAKSSLQADNSFRNEKSDKKEENLPKADDDVIAIYDSEGPSEDDTKNRENEDTLIYDLTSDHLKCPEKNISESDNNLQISSNRFSVGFDIDFSGSKSLNVTDYINDVLNKKSFETSRDMSSKRCQKINDSSSGNSSNIIKDIKDTGNKNNEIKVNTDAYSEIPDVALCSSQESNSISDEELNYSSNFNSLLKRKSRAKKRLDYSDKLTNEARISTIEISDESSSEHRPPEKSSAQEMSNSATMDDSFDRVLENLDTTCVNNHLDRLINDRDCQKNTPQKLTHNFVTSNVQTPKNTVIIKTDDVTPMADYDAMDTPKIVKELDQFGLKPLKRQRGVQLLKHIYDSTHPIVEPKNLACSDDEDASRQVKKLKKSNENKLNDEKSGDRSEKSQMKNQMNKHFSSVEIVGDLVPSGTNLDDLIFERRQSSRIASCRVPLDIVWYNFVNSNKQIKENILLYEPLQLEVLHSMLKELGFKFHIQDLLTFLDRKCITVRTVQNKGNGRRRR